MKVHLPDAKGICQKNKNTQNWAVSPHPFFGPLAFLAINVLLCIHPLKAQTLNDGPLEITIRVREINVNTTVTDAPFFGIVGQPDDYTFKLWARGKDDVDGAGWQGGACLTHNFDPPGNSTDFNQTV